MRTFKKEFDHKLADKNTKINNLLTELENTKTDLTYTNGKVTKLTLVKNEKESELASVLQTFKESQTQFESEKADMASKLQASMVKEVKLKQLEIEIAQMAKSHQREL